MKNKGLIIKIGRIWKILHLLGHSVKYQFVTKKHINPGVSMEDMKVSFENI